MQRDQGQTGKKMSGKIAKSTETKRQDQKTTAKIKEHLGNHEEIDTSGVKVDVSAGDVDLTGEVDNQHAKSLTCSITEQEIPETKQVKSDKLNYRRDNSEAP